MKLKLAQIVRFGLVGVMNTAVDFIALNLFIIAFGLAQNDPHFIFIKAGASLIAVLNSFVWNKSFVFRDDSASWRDSAVLRDELWKFLAVSVVGLVVNTAISTLVFTFGGRFAPEISSGVLANLSALAGTMFVLVTNFIGYKAFVFTNRPKKEESKPSPYIIQNLNVSAKNNALVGNNSVPQRGETNRADHKARERISS